MEKKLKTLTALLLCILCIFSACGKGEVRLPPQESKKPEESRAANGTNGSAKESNTSTEMKGEISISCLLEQEFLTAAAKQFMDNYPDVTVTINAYKKTLEPGSVEDYQTYLNTKIMTGKAEDIFFISFLPVTKYSEMGVFEDLSKYILMTPEMNDENYFMNVLQAAKEESGETYIIPYMARFNVLGFSDTLLKNQTEIENKLKALKSAEFSECMSQSRHLVDSTDKKNAFLIQMNEVSYATYLIKDSLSQFIDVKNKKANIDTTAYIDLLKSIKELSDGNYFGSGIDFYNMEYYFAATMDFDVQAAFYSLDEKAGIAYCMPLSERQGNIAISANACLAVNSASAHKDLAWEFIKYLLSEEVQSLPSIHGLAVNRQGFEAAVERYYSYYSDSKKGNGKVDKAAYGQLLKNWMEQINDCDTMDSAIWSLIEEENGKFFSDMQTAEDTAKRLQMKINQYFNEE